MAPVMRLGKQSRSEQVTNELNRSAWHIIQLRVCVCVSLCMCKVDSMRKWKSVCETDKQHKPEGLVTWWSEPVTSLKHTLWYLHIHTKANNPNFDCVIHVKGSMKEGVCWPFYSLWDAPEWALNMSHRGFAQQSQLRFHWWLTQIRRPLSYVCCIMCVCVSDLWYSYP